MNEEALQDLTRDLRALDYSPGNIVITEGTPGDTLFIISEGCVEVVINLDEPRELVLGILKKGEIFGEMSIIESYPRSASVRAIEEPTRVFALHTSELNRLFETAPTQFALLLLNISRDLCRRLRKIDDLYLSQLRPE